MRRTTIGVGWNLCGALGRVANRRINVARCGSNNSSSNNNNNNNKLRAARYSSDFFGVKSGEGMHGTTVLCVRKESDVVIVADGQVTYGQAVIKPNANKLRKIGDGVIAGFAGSTADALALFQYLESKLSEYPGQLQRACVELAKQWRTDKLMRKLEAVMIVADHKTTLMVTGTGDVLEPQDGVVAIGSGGFFALAAAKALHVPEFNLTAEQIAERAMRIAADICVYTNTNFTKLSLTTDQKKKE